MSINPALADLQPLVGRWWMELYNADFLPDRDTRLSGSIEIDGSRMAPPCGCAKGIRNILKLPSGSSAATTANPAIQFFTRTIAACRASIG